MDNPFTFDRYVELPKEEAYNLFRDEKNLRFIKHFLIILILITCIGAGINLGYSGFTATSFIMILIFLFFLSLRLFYKKIFNAYTIRKRIYTFFIVTLVAFLLSDIAGTIVRDTAPEPPKKKETVEEKGSDLRISVNEQEQNAMGLVIFFTIALLFIRLPKNDQIQMFSLAIGLPLLTDVILYSNFGADNKIGPLILGFLCFVIALSTEAKRRKNFGSQYDVYHRRHFDNIRMRKELNYAREIQLSMLPESEIEIGDIEIAATSMPANEVGGDYYDYFRISDNVTGIFICDVSGHGVASALLLSGIRSCMHLILEETANPKEVFEKLNRMVRKTQNRKMFVTAVFAVIDREKGTCSMFNAGHLPPYRISGDSYELFKIRRHGITLGAIDSIMSEEEENEVVFELYQNDKLILYTDGIIEAMNEYREEYGFERMEKFLTDNSDKKPKELLSGLMNDVNLFTGKTEKIDDISIIIIGKK